MKKIFKLIILSSCLLWSIPCFAQSISISNGITWLSSNQNVDGSWGNQTDLTFVYSTEAVNALKSIGAGSVNYTGGINWLSLQAATCTDELSRQINFLASAGTYSSGLINTLLSRRNTDDGWSYSDSPVSDTYDTALALQALKAANYADATLIGQSLNYLTANQNTDGGWGLSANDTSNTFIASVVLRTLAAYNSVFINQNSINKAAVFLLAKQTQNNDGGFGSSPSTVYDTALSLMSLIESGQGSTQTILSGINYLATTQAGNGSWNDDPYSTALALQALAEARPNLTVTSTGITFSNSMPQSGATTTISAVIHNAGYDNASNVVVRFYLGDPSTGSGGAPAGGTQIGTDQIIPFIALGASAQVSITASFTGTGGKTIFVVADPDNLISETSKADNKASARVWVATGPDLAVYSEDLKPTTYVPATGTPFTLNYTVRNLGESSTDGFDVALYDGAPSGTPLQTAHISGLAGSEIRMGTFGVTLTTNGNHTLYLVADSGNQITELSKTNNTGSVTVNVGGTLTQADLAIAVADITLMPSRPHAGDTITISANVHNIGADVANNFAVEIFDGAPEAGGALIASQTISLVAGGTQAVSANWLVPSGIHDIYVVLDRTNIVIEANENNNRASVRVMADMVDIVVTATDLSFTPSHPVNGDSVVLSITAHNTGIKNTGPFNLALYDGPTTCSGQAPESCGTPLHTFPISNIPGDGKTTVSHTFTAIPWTYRFYAVADIENVVPELYEENNTAIRSLKIKAPNETLGPDLVPTVIDLSDTLTNTQTLAISGMAHVTFLNKGDDKITTSFNILVFEDKDGDAKYISGIDTLLGKGVYAKAKFDDDPLISKVLLVTQANSPALYIEGSIYLIEHDGEIAWGPVYLKQCAPEIPPTSYKTAIVKTDIDNDGKPNISIHMNDKDVILDSDGYLKPPKI